MILTSEIRPIRFAQDTLNKYHISDPSLIDVKDIIYCENIFVKEILMESCQGNLTRQGKFGIININSKIKNKNKKRFVLAHELGHWIMHKDQMTFACTELDFNLQVNNPKKVEFEANTFAGELLMPSNLLKKDCEQKEFNFELLNSLSLKYNISLTAISIKMISLNISPIFLIFSSNGEIQWSKKSLSFSFEFFSKGSLPSNSLTFKYFKNNFPIASSEAILAKTWFNKDLKVKDDSYLTELVVYILPSLTP